MFEQIRGPQAVRRQEMGVRWPPLQPRLRTQLRLQLDPQSGQKRELELEPEEWERSLQFHREPQ
jgi:hypothetical protein